MLFQMLTAAIASGFTIRVLDDEGYGVDYTNVRDALDEIEGVDEADIHIIDPSDNTVEGSAFIVNGLDEDERIADAGGWVDHWLEDNA